jgi:hypothetical protein
MGANARIAGFCFAGFRDSHSTFTGPDLGRGGNGEAEQQYGRYWRR